MMKGQWRPYKGKGESEINNRWIKHYTVGRVTTHTFNNSPPGTKAAWLRAGEGGKKYPHTCSKLFIFFQLRDTQNSTTKQNKQQTTLALLLPRSWCEQITGAMHSWPFTAACFQRLFQMGIMYLDFVIFIQQCSLILRGMTTMLTSTGAGWSIISPVFILIYFDCTELQLDDFAHEWFHIFELSGTKEGIWP